MCKMYEKVTGKKVVGSVDRMEGITKMYTDQHLRLAIINIPTNMLEIDPRYQTDYRTERSLSYLTSNWDERKLLPITVVPHWEEGKFYVVDGYGRWIASQIVARDSGTKELYKDLQALVLLQAPTDPVERLKYEAELYAFQGDTIAKVTPIQKHGAMLVMHNQAAEKLEQLKAEYGFEYVAEKGNREAAVLGSYSDVFNLCKIDNGKCADYVFDIINRIAFDRMTNGYSSYVIRAFRDMYKLYANNRNDVKNMLIHELRGKTPLQFKSNAVTRYPVLDVKTACSLYTEDMVVDILGLKQNRMVLNDKVVTIESVNVPKLNNIKAM